ncbi:MAG TPA: hypothetical protein VNK81_07070 [Thermodesulfobacteriota bacterium]|nr:hypothetical protein [Thermodesulfobacteriota bacterium]
MVGVFKVDGLRFEIPPNEALLVLEKPWLKPLLTNPDSLVNRASLLPLPNPIPIGAESTPPLTKPLLDPGNALPLLKSPFLKPDTPLLNPPLNPLNPPALKAWA